MNVALGSVKGKGFVCTLLANCVAEISFGKWSVLIFQGFHV